MYNPYNQNPCAHCAYAARCSSNGMFNAYEPYQNPYLSNQAAPELTRYFDNEYYPNDYETDFYRLDDSDDSEPITLKDYGPQPYVVDLDKATKQNTNYRTALWTGKHLQLTLMSINVGEDIGVEVHPVIDQFIRVEQGKGKAQMGPTKNNLNFQQDVSDGSAIFVPAGTWHNVVNTGDVPLKLYSIYAPPQHPRGTVHATKAIAHGGSSND